MVWIAQDEWVYRGKYTEGWRDEEERQHERKEGWAYSNLTA
jgi:hypothetical protein